MILINNVQKKPEEVARQFGVPLEELKKSTEYKINEDLKGYDLGSKKKRDFGELRFPSFFFVDDKDGISHEIRYARSKANVKDKQGKINEIYSPKKVQIDGDVTVVTKLDLALFLYLSKKNKQSPFRKDGESAIWSYEFVDRQGIAKQTIGRGDAMLEALSHAKKSKGQDLRMVAKGMGIEDVDGMSELQIQAALSDLALVNPTLYLSKVNKQTTKMEGLVLDAVDKNIFKLDETMGTPKWLWAVGSDKGQLVCEVTNNSIAPNKFLINYIMGHIDQFYSKMLNIQNEIHTYDKAEAFLESQLNPMPKVDREDFTYPTKDTFMIDKVEPVIEEESEPVFEDFEDDEENDITPEVSSDGVEFESQSNFEFKLPVSEEPIFPTDFQSAKEYLSWCKNGANPSNAHSKKLLDATKLEGLQPSTIREWVTENIGY